MSFPAEVASAVRAAIGTSALLTLNFSVDRMDNPSAPLEEDAGEFRELVEALCGLPIDALHFSTRNHATTLVHGAPAVRVVRRAATKPLISGGNVRSLGEADALLDAGVDLVAVGRPFLANPDWIGRELRGLPSRPFARGMHLVPAGNDDLRVPPGDVLAAWPLMFEEA